MDLKVSRYTHICEYEDGLCIGYNALTGKFLRLNGVNKTHIRTALLSKQVPQRASTFEIEQLKSLGFLLDFDIDERVVVREVRRIGVADKGDVLLTILPTLRCNFACKYCFQRHSAKTMSIEVEEALLRFLESYVLPGTKSLAIQWYGGEPLLALPTLERLSHRISATTESHGCRLAPACIVTNGSLLSAKNVSRLLKAGVRSAQVTLDGPEAVHNNRRPLANGQGSFNTIIKNIKAAASTLRIAIRINVDRENRLEIFTLLEQIRDLGVLDRAAAYVAPVECYISDYTALKNTRMTPEEFAKFFRSLAQQCLDSAIPLSSNVNSVSPSMLEYCIAESRSGFVVKPDGELVDCWAKTDCRLEPLANLLKPDTLSHLSTLARVESKVLSDELCCDCNLLPICIGGCPVLHDSTQNPYTKRCPPIRYNLHREIRAQYESSRETVK